MENFPKKSLTEKQKRDDQTSQDIVQKIRKLIGFLNLIGWVISFIVAVVGAIVIYGLATFMWRGVGGWIVVVVFFGVLIGVKKLFFDKKVLLEGFATLTGRDPLDFEPVFVPEGAPVYSSTLADKQLTLEAISSPTQTVASKQKDISSALEQQVSSQPEEVEVVSEEESKEVHSKEEISYQLPAQLEPNPIVEAVKNFFAENALAKIGGVLIFLAVMFLLKLVYAQIGNVGKLMIGFAIGFGLILTGVILDKKNFVKESRVMLGVGILVNYLVILSGRYLLGADGQPLFSSLLTFGLLIANTIFAIVASLFYRSPTLLFFAFLLAYLNPFLIGSKGGGGDSSGIGLMAYSLLVSFAALGLSFKLEGKYSKGLWLGSLILGALLVLVAPVETLVGLSIKMITGGVLATVAGILALKPKQKELFAWAVGVGWFLAAFVIIFGGLVVGEVKTYSLIMKFLVQAIFTGVLILLMFLSVLGGENWGGSKVNLLGLIGPILGLIGVGNNLIGIWHFVAIMAAAFGIFWNMVGKYGQARKYAFLILGILNFIPAVLLAYKMMGHSYDVMFATNFWAVNLGLICSAALVIAFLLAFAWRFKSWEFLILAVGGVLANIGVALVGLRSLIRIKRAGYIGFYLAKIDTVTREERLNQLLLGWVGLGTLVNLALLKLIKDAVRWPKIKSSYLALALLATMGLSAGLVWVLANRLVPGVGVGLAMLGLGGFYFFYTLDWLKLLPRGDDQEEVINIKDLIVASLGGVFTLFALAAVYVLSSYGEYKAVFWLVEGLVLLWLLNRFDDIKLFILGLAFIAVGMIKWLSLGLMSGGDINFIIIILLTLSLTVGAIIVSKPRNISIERIMGIGYGILLLIFWISLWNGLDNVLWKYMQNGRVEDNLLSTFLAFVVGLIITAILISKSKNVYLKGFLGVVWSVATLIFMMDGYEKMGIIIYIVILTLLAMLAYFSRNELLRYKTWRLALMMVAVALIVLISRLIYLLFDSTFAITIFWAIVSGLILMSGINTNYKPIRTIGLYGLMLVVLKVIGYDIWVDIDSAVLRVVALMVVGGLMIFISLLYSKKYGGDIKGELDLANINKIFR